LPKVTIDGKTYDAPEGANVLEVCHAFGVKMEHFCYHRYLKVDGNCRTCMVEVEGPRGRALVTGCTTPVTEGMVVHTVSPKAEQARRSALEFLLLDHPLDCPVCDKAGECRLQDNYMEHGLHDARRGVPRFFKGGKAVDVGEHIVLDQERCILCRRCVRFLDAVTGTNELCVTGRGHESVLDLFPGKRLNNAYSGCVTDVCPVGALTLKEFRFKQRVWLLKKTQSVCDGCARGCNITLEHNRGRVWRIMPRENPELNRVWICDEGRLGFAKLREDRLEGARREGRPLPWAEAFAKAAETLRGYQRGEVAVFASPWASLEDNWMLQRLFQARFDPRDMAAPAPAAVGTCDDILRLSDKTPNATGLRWLGIPSDPTSILKGMESGRLKALVMMENDPIEWGGDHYQALLRRLPFRLLMTPYRTAGVDEATFTLPVRAFAEKDGTFLNAEGRLQRFRRAVDPSDATVRSSSMLLSSLAKREGAPELEFQSEAEVFDAMARERGDLDGLTFETIPATGKVLGLSTDAPPPFKRGGANPNVVPPEGRGRRMP